MDWILEESMQLVHTLKEYKGSRRVAVLLNLETRHRVGHEDSEIITTRT